MPAPFTFPKPSGTTIGVAALLLLAPIAGSHAAPADKARWVHGSWVNVRAAADAASPVLAQVTANTPVTLLAQAGAACQIAWGEGREGYVPCRLLGEAPLRFADVAPSYVPGADKQNPLYSPPRAFWISPSMAGLFEAGKYFQQTLLAEKQRNLEGGRLENGDCCASEKPAKLVRYPVPEFEAMKTLLAKGIVAGADMDPPFLSCKRMQEAHDQQRSGQDRPWYQWDYPDWQINHPHAFPFANDCRMKGLPSLQLPAARPSFFRNPADVLPGSAAIERMSAHFKLLEKGRVVGSPRWEHDYDMWRYTGAWDIGRYEQTLEKPVVEHVIGRNGLVGAYRWLPQQTVTPNPPSEGCVEGLIQKRRGKELLAGYPAVKDALFWFQSPTPLPLQKVKIKSRTERLPVPKGAPQPGDYPVFTKVVIYEVDLDDDGVADFVQWDQWSKPEISGPDPMLGYRNLYININGEWYPFDQDTYGECT